MFAVDTYPEPEAVGLQEIFDEARRYVRDGRVGTSETGCRFKEQAD